MKTSNFKDYNLNQPSFEFASNRILSLQISKDSSKIFGSGWDDDRIFIADFPQVLIRGNFSVTSKRRFFGGSQRLDQVNSTLGAAAQANSVQLLVRLYAKNLGG